MDKDNCERHSHKCYAKNFELTSALPRPSFYSFPSISYDGRQIYVVYENVPGQLAAEIFDNVDGKLVTRASLSVNPDFPYVVGGKASPDFSLFYIVDATESTPTTGLARLCLFDNKLNPIRSVIIPITFENFAYVIAEAGTFSQDGKYITVNYSNGAPNSTTTIFVFKTSDLSIVVQQVVSGVDFEPGKFINLECNGKEKLYIVFQSSQGYYSSNYEVTLQPPFYMQVYKVNIKKGTLTLAAQALLPKFAGYDVLNLGKKALVSGNGFTSYFPNQLTIYDTNYLKTTFLPNDNAEGRSFEFDGEKLKLIWKDAVDFCTRILYYPPAKGYEIMLGQNILTNTNGSADVQVLLQEFYILAKVKPENKKSPLKAVNLPRQDMLNALPIFSPDGKWFLRVGSYGYYNNEPAVDAVGIRNVLLFKVIRD